MVFQKIFNQVADQDKWVSGFKEHSSARKGFTCVGASVYTEPGNKQNITIVLKWSDGSKMQKFGSSNTLKNAMKNAGVVGSPEMDFCDTNTFDVSQLEFQFLTDS